MNPPKYFVFDTETTGLFVFRDRATGEPVPADAPGQPRLASMSYVIADQDGKALDSGRHFVRPDGWTMAEFDRASLAQGKKSASSINGLTDDVLNEKGQPVAEILDIWNEAIDDGLIAVAFNAQFDAKMMRAELRRAGLPDRFDETPNVCVMRALAPYGAEGMPVMRGYIKLSEACDWFGIVNDNPHDASADAEAARAILERLIRDGRMPEPKVHYAKNRADS